MANADQLRAYYREFGLVSGMEARVNRYLAAADARGVTELPGGRSGLFQYLATFTSRELRSLME